MKPRAPALELPPLPPWVAEAAARRALEEDLGEAGDVTSEAALPLGAKTKAVIAARARGRVAGMQVAQAVFRLADPSVRVVVTAPDGADVNALDPLCTVEGDARAILMAERAALNFLGRLSGIATLTRAYAAAVDGLMTHIAATRKTTPGLRALEKHAVRAGGGAAHRFGLFDAILVKDNHIAIAGGVGAALMAVRARAGHMAHVGVEVDGLAELEEALRYAPDVVLLDNFALPQIAEAVRLVGARCTVEASGGVTLETVRAIAETGVDVVSVGALTHSAPALDVGMDIG